MSVVAKELNVSTTTVFNYLHKYGIDTRDEHDHPTSQKVRDTWKELGRMGRGRKLSDETKRKISESHKKHGPGHKKKRQDGYIVVHYPDHPNSTKSGYVMEHKLVMEKHIGRYLEKDEVVHHKNGNRADNRIENLALMTFNEHSALHLKERRDTGKLKHATVPVINVTTGEYFESIKKAAKKYGIPETHISRVCKGKRNHTGGCAWRYADLERTKA